VEDTALLGNAESSPAIEFKYKKVISENKKV